MLKQSKVEQLMAAWNRSAAQMFIAASTQPPDVAERNRGKAEAMAICAAELRAASEE